MKKLVTFIIALMCGLTNFVNAQEESDDTQSEKGFIKNLGQLPNNIGEKTPEVAYYSSNSNDQLYLTSDNKVSYQKCNFYEPESPFDIYRMDIQFPNHNNATLTEGEQIRTNNYYVGGLPEIVDGVPVFDSITMTNLYDGVDLTIINNASFNFLFTVQPHISTDVIRFSIGANTLYELSSDGGLTINTPIGDFDLENLQAWQMIHNEKKLITAQLSTITNGTFGFAISSAQIDESAAIYIQLGAKSPSPIIIPSTAQNVKWSTFVEGSFNQFINDVYRTDNNDIYVAGYTYSTHVFASAPNVVINNYPIIGLIKPDAFIYKFNASKKLLNATYIGGSLDDEFNNIEVDGDGRVVAVGFTGSSNLPTSISAVTNVIPN